MSSTTPAVGIDLGTTYSIVAYIDESGRAVTIPNEAGDLLTPSAVFVDFDQIIVGKEAIRASVMSPSAYAECFKRDIGSAAYRREVHGQKVPPEILSALVLERLRQSAERRLGPIQKAVVTVPAFFDENRRRMTQDAARLAGLEVLDIVNEPTAAALAFGCRPDGLAADDPGEPRHPLRVLVYDLGGGTFDVTVLEINGRRFKTLATDGDVRLGGKDFDERLVKHLANRFQQAHGVDPRSDPQDAAQLWIDAQEAKHSLSERSKTTVVCFHAGVRMRIEVLREEFEEMTADLLERTETTASLVVRQAGLEWSDIDRVLLVGGSSRMPMVRSILRQLTGREPDCSYSPDEVVAHGAALYAQMLLTENPADEATANTLVNVNAHSLGVVGLEPSTGQMRNVILIPKNTPLPAGARRTFRTAKADQRSVQVRVVEGEADRPEDCIMLGRCVIRNLPPGLPVGAAVEVEYRYGANGCISVAAKVPSIRYSAHVEIERERVSQAEDLKTWRARLLGQSMPEATAAVQPATTATVNPADRAGVLQRLDILYAKVGRAALLQDVPAVLSASREAALAAAREVSLAQRGVTAAERAADVSLHDAAGFQRHAGVARAKAAHEQAVVRADFTCLILGRECIDADFMPPHTEKEAGEIRSLRQTLKKLEG